MHNLLDVSGLLLSIDSTRRTPVVSMTRAVALEVKETLKEASVRDTIIMLRSSNLLVPVLVSSAAMIPLIVPPIKTLPAALLSSVENTSTAVDQFNIYRFNIIALYTCYHMQSRQAILLDLFSYPSHLPSPSSTSITFVP